MSYSLMELRIRGHLGDAESSLGDRAALSSFAGDRLHHILVPYGKPRLRSMASAFPCLLRLDRHLQYHTATLQRYQSRGQRQRRRKPSKWC